VASIVTTPVLDEISTGKKSEQMDIEPGKHQSVQLSGSSATDSSYNMNTINSDAKAFPYHELPRAGQCLEITAAQSPVGSSFPRSFSDRWSTSSSRCWRAYAPNRTILQQQPYSVMLCADLEAQFHMKQFCSNRQQLTYNITKQTLPQSLFECTIYKDEPTTICYLHKPES